MCHTWVPELAPPLCSQVTLGQSPSTLKSTDKEDCGEEEEEKEAGSSSHALSLYSVPER